MALAFGSILFTLLLFIYFNHYLWLVKGTALRVYSWLHSPSQFGPGSFHFPYLPKQPFWNEHTVTHPLNETLKNDSSSYFKRLFIICGFFFLPKFQNQLCLLIYDQDFEVFKFAQSWQNTTSGFQLKEEGSLESLLMPLDHNEIKLENFFFYELSANELETCELNFS